MLVIVTGPANTGSRLCAKTIAHVLGVCKYSKWNGMGWSPPKKNKHSKILHRSTPYGRTTNGGDSLNVKNIIKKYGKNKLLFVFTTRDTNISNVRLKKNRKNYTDKDVSMVVKQNINLIKEVKENNVSYFFWSFETTLLYKHLYLQELYKFLGVESDYVPPIYDANKKYIKNNENRNKRIR